MISALHCEQARKIDLTKADVQGMIDSCKIQKNVNMTVKDGLKKIKELIAAINRDHSLATEKENNYEEGLAMTEESRQERR